jgi:hypothetical protein
MKWLAVIIVTLLTTGGIGGSQPNPRGVIPTTTVSPILLSEEKEGHESNLTGRPTGKHEGPSTSPILTTIVQPTEVVRIATPGLVIGTGPKFIGPTKFKCPPPLTVNNPTQVELVCLDEVVSP